MAHDTLEHTRAYMEATQDTHTRTRRPEVAVNSRSAFSRPGLSFLQDPPGAGPQRLHAPQEAGAERAEPQSGHRQPYV